MKKKLEIIINYSDGSGKDLYVFYDEKLTKKKVYDLYEEYDEKLQTGEFTQYFSDYLNKLGLEHDLIIL